MEGVFSMRRIITEFNLEQLKSVNIIPRDLYIWGNPAGAGLEQCRAS
jgi:hypothetical protein